MDHKLRCQAEFGIFLCLNPICYYYKINLLCFIEKSSGFITWGSANWIFIFVWSTIKYLHLPLPDEHNACCTPKRTERRPRGREEERMEGWVEQKNVRAHGLQCERDLFLWTAESGLVKRSRRRHMAPARAAFGVTGRREGERMRQQAREMMKRTLPSAAQGRETAAQRPNRGHWLTPDMIASNTEMLNSDRCQHC